MAAYGRVTFRGRAFDRMTAAGVEHWEYLLGRKLNVVQGPFSTAVGASAGTHAGSGAVDADHEDGMDPGEVQWAGRLAGWAVWFRPAIPDLWGAHYHGIQLGNLRISDDARKQVQDYYAHLDGLRSHRPDSSKHPNPIVRFSYPLGVVDLGNVRVEAQKTSGHKALTGVRHIQRALNLKTGTELTVDGIYGKQTRQAAKRFEVQVGGDGDGVLGGYAAKLLGAARYRLADG